VPRLVLARPAWRPVAGDVWIEVADLAEAAMVLPRYGRRAFVTTGRRDLDAFAALDEMWFLVRLVDMPDAPLPLPDCRVVAARGPFGVAEERRLLEAHAIDVLVCKASGGAATAAKLVAARALGLPVIMIGRPPPPPGRVVADIEAALDAIRAALDASRAARETSGR
jgi:precorrin-6A/cobalt-precorrin-6A reductase